MINFILVLIGFISPESIKTETYNSESQIQQSINLGNNLENNDGYPVGGNSGQLPPP